MKELYGKILETEHATVTLRQLHNQCHEKTPVTNIRINLSAHKRHQSFADKKSKPISLHFIRIAATMKALKYLWQLFRFKRAARI